MEDLLDMAIPCGVSVKEFWSMTPKQVIQTISGYYKRLEHEREEHEYFAWLQGLYNRSARFAKNYPDMPAPKTRNKQQKQKEMSEKQMKSIMRGLSKRR